MTTSEGTPGGARARRRATGPTPGPTTAPTTAPTTGDVAADEHASAERLGRAVRALRHERGLTLVQLAGEAGLSHSFLSQLENARARPSMRSLFEVARVLGTTQQALLGLAAAPTGRTGDPSRGGDAPLVDVEPGGARLLLHDPAGVDVTEFVGAPRDLGDVYVHDHAELLYVARGSIEVETTPEPGAPTRRVVLAERDTLGYPGGVPHRFRQLGATTCVVLALHTGVTVGRPVDRPGAEDGRG